MTRRTFRICAFALLAVFTCLLSSACSQHRPASTPAQAELYYSDKYGTHEDVVSSKELSHNRGVGNEVYGTRYEMSDGTYIICFDNTGDFIDNRQSLEIDEAAKARLAEAAAELPDAILPVQVMSVSGQYWDGDEYWDAFFDGDAEPILRSQRPLAHFRTGQFIADAEMKDRIEFNAICRYDSPQQVDGVVEACEESLSPLCSGHLDVLFVSGDHGISWSGDPFLNSDVEWDGFHGEQTSSFSTEDAVCMAHIDLADGGKSSVEYLKAH